MENKEIDDLDEIRRQILAAEEAEIWQEEPEDESDEADSNNQFDHASGNTEIIGKETKYQAHVFKVSKLNVRLPTGNIRQYDLVEHAPAVTIVPVTDDGQILFVRQFRMGADQEILELPAGILNGEDGNEDPQEGAERECREETGYEAKSIRRLGGFYMTPGYCTEYIHVFLAQKLVWNPLPQDEDEFLKVIQIPIEEAYRMAEAGEMNDVKTIAALMFAKNDIHFTKQS